MRKIALTTVILLVIGISSTNAQIAWGIRAGASYPIVTASRSGGTANIEGRFGIEAGPVLYYSLQNGFYISTGAMFSMKSFEDVDPAYYIDIPLYAGMNLYVGVISLYLQTGIYAGIKVAGWEDVKTFTGGLAAMAGINISKFKIEIGYQYGHFNIIDKNGLTAKLGSVFLGLSYVF